MAVTFTNYVGVAPATTTMQLGCGVCPPAGLGVCPPGHYGPQVMLPGAVQMPAAAAGQAIAVDPYATESKLSGLGAARMLRGLGAVRWDVGLLGFGLAFAGVLGYALWRRK